MFLVIVLLGAICGGFIALQIDRPDLLVGLTARGLWMVDVALAVLFLLILLRVSWAQIREHQLSFGNAARILSRNALVLLGGIVLMVYIGRMLLNGIDPTGRRRLW